MFLLDSRRITTEDSSIENINTNGDGDNGDKDMFLDSDEDSLTKILEPEKEKSASKNSLESEIQGDRHIEENTAGEQLFDAREQQIDVREQQIDVREEDNSVDDVNVQEEENVVEENLIEEKTNPASKRKRFFETNKNNPLPDRLNTTKIESFRNQYKTWKSKAGMLQISIPTSADFFLGMMNNVQLTKEEMIEKGVPGNAAETAGKYMVHGQGEGRDLMLSIFDPEKMIFLDDSRNKIKKDPTFYEEYKRYKMNPSNFFKRNVQQTPAKTTLPNSNTVPTSPFQQSSPTHPWYNPWMMSPPHMMHSMHNVAMPSYNPPQYPYPPYPQTPTNPPFPQNPTNCPFPPTPILPILPQTTRHPIFPPFPQTPPATHFSNNTSPQIGHYAMPHQGTMPSPNMAPTLGSHVAPSLPSTRVSPGLPSADDSLGLSSANVSPVLPSTSVSPAPVSLAPVQMNSTRPVTISSVLSR